MPIAMASELLVRGILGSWEEHALWLTDPQRFQSRIVDLGIAKRKKQCSLLAGSASGVRLPVLRCCYQPAISVAASAASLQSRSDRHRVATKRRPVTPSESG